MCINETVNVARQMHGQLTILIFFFALCLYNDIKINISKKKRKVECAKALLICSFLFHTLANVTLHI